MKIEYKIISKELLPNGALKVRTKYYVDGKEFNDEINFGAGNVLSGHWKHDLEYRYKCMKEIKEKEAELTKLSKDELIKKEVE